MFITPLLCNKLLHTNNIKGQPFYVKADVIIADKTISKFDASNDNNYSCVLFCCAIRQTREN